MPKGIIPVHCECQNKAAVSTGGPDRVQEVRWAFLTRVCLLASGKLTFHEMGREVSDLLVAVVWSRRHSAELPLAAATQRPAFSLLLQVMEASEEGDIEADGLTPFRQARLEWLL
jgi:hypothetical protein